MPTTRTHKELPMFKHPAVCLSVLVLCGAGIAGAHPDSTTPASQPTTTPRPTTTPQPTTNPQPTTPPQPAPCKQPEAPATDKAMPRIAVLASGGTIAGKANTNSAVGYTSGQVTAQDLIEAVPGI